MARSAFPGAAGLWLGWLGWALVGLGVALFVISYRYVGLVLSFGRPEELWLRDGRLAYHVRMAGPYGMRRPENWS